MAAPVFPRICTCSIVSTLQSVLNAAGSKELIHGRRREVRPYYFTAPGLALAEGSGAHLHYIPAGRNRLPLSQQHGASIYLPRDLNWAGDNNFQQGLRSSTCTHLKADSATYTRLHTVGDRTFGVASAGIWNNLPLTIRSATSLNTFKTQETF